MKILNYTPHSITLIDYKGESTEYPSNGVARCEEIKSVVGSAGGYPIYEVKYGNLSGLPEWEDNTVIVVSVIAAQAAKAAGRTDCLIVTDVVRNDKGQVIGARGFASV